MAGLSLEYFCYACTYECSALKSTDDYRSCPGWPICYIASAIDCLDCCYCCVIIRILYSPEICAGGESPLLFVVVSAALEGWGKGLLWIWAKVAGTELAELINGLLLLLTAALNYYEG